MTSKVKEVRKAEKKRADEALAAARMKLHDLRTKVGEAKKKAGDEAARAGALQAAAKDLRAQLAAAEVKADLDRLGRELEANMRNQRAAAALVSKTAFALMDTEQREADLAAEVEAATKAAAAAATAYADAEAQEKQLDGWRAALSSPATADAIAAAGAATTGEDYRKAATRLERLLGDPSLLELYRRRAEWAADEGAGPSDLLRDAIEVAAEVRKDVEPLIAARMEAAALLAARIDEMQHAAETVVSRVAAAMKVFAQLAARDPAAEELEPLRAQLAELKKRAARVVAADAVAKEKARLEKEAELQDAQQLEEVAEGLAIGDTPDTAADEQPEAVDERAATRAAKEEVKDAEAVLVEPVEVPDEDDDIVPQAALDDYEVAVPVDVLADLVSFLDAEAAVTGAKALRPDTLLKNLDDAEKAYADAEQVEVRERRAVAIVDARVEARRRRLTVSRGTVAAERLLTIRGDG